MPAWPRRLTGAAIQSRELAEFCIQRHGDEVLEGLINRQPSIRSASGGRSRSPRPTWTRKSPGRRALFVKAKPDGSPDVEAWLKTVTEQQGVSKRLIAVTPSGPRKR